jgi:hypothetical protein
LVIYGDASELEVIGLGKLAENFIEGTVIDSCVDGTGSSGGEHAGPG